MSDPLLHLAVDSVQILASSKSGPVPVLLDRFDAERLGGRGVSLGSHKYAQIWADGQRIPLHRWILNAVRGDGKLVDHISGDKYDCRKANLRFVSYAENAANRVCSAASGYRGVTKCGLRWAARGKVAGRSYHLGVFDTPQEAARVAHQWRQAHLPGYTGRGAITTPAAHKSVAA